MKAWRHTLVSATAIALGACTTPLSVSEINSLCSRIPEPVKLMRQEASVSIQSRQLSGEFHAVLVARSAPFGVRLQMFPEVGGKVLDILATLESQKGLIPMTGAAYDSSAPSQGTILQLFAASVGTALSPITPTEVTHAWRDHDGTPWLSLAPRFGLTECVVSIEDQGTRTFRLRSRTQWRMTVSNSAVHIDAPGFQLRAAVDAHDELRDAPSGIFHLQVPRGPGW